MADSSTAQPLGDDSERGSTGSIGTDSITGSLGSTTETGNTGLNTGFRTATIISPGMASAPKLDAIRGWRLGRILLVTTLALVLVLVGLMAWVSQATTSHQFAEAAGIYKHQLKKRARELGDTVSHTLALTTATPLRDNNYGFLGEVVSSIIKDNHNVERVQIFDAQGLSVADSDKSAKLGTPSGREVKRLESPGVYHGKSVLEYQEPIDFGSADGKGLVVLSYSSQPLQHQLAELNRMESETQEKTVWYTVLIGLAFMLLAGVVVVFQSRGITRPLNRLHDGVTRLASGDLEARVSESGGAVEVKTLGAVFNNMADRIGWLLEDARTKAQLEREVSLARTVQETLLPSRDVLVVGPLRIAGTVITADACGGDWWLRATLDDGRVVLGVGDVTGHGLSTALVATSATSGFAAAVKMSEAEQLHADGLASSLNQTLFLVGRGEYQMSSALAIFDLTRAEVEYAAGAHPSPAVVNKADGQTAALMARGPLLGASPQSQYTARKTALRPGDLMVWYTDGLTESQNEKGEQYGMQRLIACMKQNLEMTAERLRDAILYDVRQFTSNQPQADDITVVVAEYAPTPVRENA